MVAENRLPFDRRWWLLLILMVAGIMIAADHADAQGDLIRVPYHGDEVPGKPLVKTSQELFMLGRDGQLYHFLRKDVKRTIKTNESFTSLSSHQLRGQLTGEFGKHYDVTASGPFLVVHPVGERGEWPKRFDSLYRAFVHYFTARGWRPQSPDFPLVAVVFRSRAEFLGYARRQNDSIDPSVLGYYSPRTNRIVLFDQSNGNSEASPNNWQTNAATIVHEAAHQTAFNMGIHSRFAPPPRWCIEGLGTMFEAQGVCNPFRNPDLSSRVNRLQRTVFLRSVDRGWTEGRLARLVQSDRLFSEAPNEAYALAWAISFYLAETQPRNYIGYLQTTAARQDFSPYSSAQRWQDFVEHFGENVELLESRLIRYIEKLPD